MTLNQSRSQFPSSSSFLSFKENGYLFLASPQGEATLRENHAAQRYSTGGREGGWVGW
jgi:hypothetical protein